MSENEVSTFALQQTIKKLEQENKTLKDSIKQVQRDRVEYLQNVSHQLIAPLNAIKWHIENITDQRIGIERAKKVLRSIYSQATLAVHLAKNFNLMSNLEADHTLHALKEPLKEVDLYRLLINLANDFQPLAWDKQIDIGVNENHFDKFPPVLAMKPLISQAFSNIIENAVKYSDKGTEIVIEGKYQQESDSFVVSFRNRGIPISPEDESKIFNREFRTAEAKRMYPAGTGFGLYITKRILEIHESSIVATTRDRWTVFMVTLTVKGLKGKARIRG
ncbi:MAG: HAMP domain-containing histidine kinase [Proteobacteria bacterium]|nr:HAMP domain-containing histidine kinase [Pseudomonadota bacterium]